MSEEFDGYWWSPVCDSWDTYKHAAHKARTPLAEEMDVVNRPPHYTQSPSGVECIEVVEHMNYCVGNAIKYLWRAGLKGEELEDLK